MPASDNEDGEIADSTPANVGEGPHAHTNEQVEAGSNDSVESEQGDLLGGVVGPRDGTAEPQLSNPAISQDAQQTERVKRLERFGPYRRWSWYRKSRDDEGEFWRERDPPENENGRLPADERVEVPAIWVTELYTQSTVSGLLDGIGNLGWEYGRSRDESVAKWMSDVRHGRSAGWTSLGLVSPVDDRHFLDERTADLPRNVKAAFPVLMSVTPSLTALVVCFVMTDESAQRLDEPLRADYTTYTERDPLFKWYHVLPHVLWNRPIRLGRRYHTPDFQRRDAIARQITDLEGQCMRWVRTNLPGVFASDLRGGLYPTAMLFVTDKARPLTEEARQMRALEGTGLDRDYDSWQSDEWPGCRMALPHAWRKEELRLRFGCRRHDAFPEQPGYWEPESNWTISQRANDLIRGLIVRWALSCLLDGYHQLLSTHRDRSAQDTSYKPVRDLRHLRSLVRTDIYDILSSASEVASFAKSNWRYAHNVLQMEYVRTVRGKKVELLKQLRSSQTQRSRQVEEEAQLLLAALSTSAEMTQTISNIRVQRLLALLTAISIAIAVMAIVIALSAGSP